MNSGFEIADGIVAFINVLYIILLCDETNLPDYNFIVFNDFGNAFVCSEAKNEW